MTNLIGDDGANTLVGGDGADLIQGLGGDDVLTGGNGDDSLDGGTGADTMTGGLGDDTYTVDSAGDQVVEDPDEGHDTIVWTGSASAYTLGDGVEDFTLTGSPDGHTVQYLGGVIAHVIGNEADNFISVLHDFETPFTTTVEGLGGDDVIWGDGHGDSLSGGDGDDQLYGGDGDSLDGGGGQDYLLAQTFFGAPTGTASLSGGADDDTLFDLEGQSVLDGGDGDDTLGGQGAKDTLTGGAGSDQFQLDASIYNDSGAYLVTDFEDGTDRILITPDGSENVTSMADIASIAQDGDDTAITTTAGGTMRLAGIDASSVTIDDFVFYDRGSETADDMQGSAGTDQMVALGGSDHLKGGKGDDILRGGAGNDVLDGGAGRDREAGGGGADTFVYHRVSDSGDRITDFAAAKGDVIDLSRIDADSHSHGDQAFHFVTAFDGHAGEAVLAYDGAHDRTVLQLDVDGDGHADFKLTMSGHVTIDHGWVL